MRRRRGEKGKIKLDYAPYRFMVPLSFRERVGVRGRWSKFRTPKASAPSAVL